MGSNAVEDTLTITNSRKQEFQMGHINIIIDQLSPESILL